MPQVVANGDFGRLIFGLLLPTAPSSETYFVKSADELLTAVVYSACIVNKFKFTRRFNMYQTKIQSKTSTEWPNSYWPEQEWPEAFWPEQEWPESMWPDQEWPTVA